MVFPIYQPAKPAHVKRARTMRRAMTEAEGRLWRALRHRLSTHHFRRQVPIGDYTVDFCCYGSRLVIEVDGNQHGFELQRLHDERRTMVLETQGFRVIRFSNHDVFRAIDSVLDTIFAHLDAGLGQSTSPVASPQPGLCDARPDPHPLPLPARGRGS